MGDLIFLRPDAMVARPAEDCKLPSGAVAKLSFNRLLEPSDSP